MLRVRSAATLLAPVVLTACATAYPDDSPPSFDEFEASTYREPWENGVYIINGDTPIVDRKALREAWLGLYGNSGQALIVHRAGGLDARWNETDKRNLTYCVSNGFGARKAEVIAAMRAATEEGWERFADVNFVHVESEDAACDANNQRVLFDVRPVSGQPYLARAFFPNQPRSTRNVLIDSTAFNTSWTLANILGHEAGHALGFRHEHTRPESGTCFEDSNWRPLTPYDSASVMHYPQCNGTADDLSFTATDAQGAAALYGPPAGPDPDPDPDPEPDPDPVPQEDHYTGSLAGGEWLTFQVYEVEPGSRFEVALDGTGDPDLYVRFGDAPTKQEYDCRPYLDGAGELCALDVPADATAAHVALHGFTPATYDMSVRYVGDGGGGGGGGGGTPKLVINEILADPGAGLDANRDGVFSSTDDEMLELVNVGDAPIDLSGVTISDAVAVRVVFPAVTLDAGAALVVFGGGVPQPLPGVRVLTGRLYFNNDGDTVTVRDPSGAELATAIYGNNASNDVSVVRETELDENAPFVRHTEVTSLPVSPGRRADGSPF
jgi:serine protease